MGKIIVALCCMNAGVDATSSVHPKQSRSSFGAITEFDEITVRQLVSNIKVVSEDTLLICFKDGTEITQTMENTGRASA